MASDDGDAMRKAFEQFMLTGGNAPATDTASGKTANSSSTTSGKKKKKKRPSSASLTPKTVTPMKQKDKEESDAEYFQLKVTRQLKKWNVSTGKFTVPSVVHFKESGLILMII
eukprot:scaffold131595_cov53-Attheya_sp.AAC.9